LLDSAALSEALVSYWLLSATSWLTALWLAGDQDNGGEDYSFYKTFGKSKVTDVARDGSITFTFEEDDDVDAQSLSSQLLGSS